jgi:uncharacterized protein YbjT (DUF2867 family)
VSRVLLTGGTGFVGRQILKRLLARGCHVRMAVRTAVSVPDEVEQMVVVSLLTGRWRHQFCRNATPVISLTQVNLHDRTAS